MAASILRHTVEQTGTDWLVYRPNEGQGRPERAGEGRERNRADAARPDRGAASAARPRRRHCIGVEAAELTAQLKLARADAQAAAQAAEALRQGAGGDARKARVAGSQLGTRSPDLSTGPY